MALDVLPLDVPPLGAKALGARGLVAPAMGATSLVAPPLVAPPWERPTLGAGGRPARTGGVGATFGDREGATGWEGGSKPTSVEENTSPPDLAIGVAGRSPASSMGQDLLAADRALP
jgi:hypothetical protein